MSKPLGVGIVGYGKVGAVTHRNWINESPDAQLVAVCDATDVRREAARSDNPEATVYADYAAMLADPRVELAIRLLPRPKS